MKLIDFQFTNFATQRNTWLLVPCLIALFWSGLILFLEIGGLAALENSRHLVFQISLCIVGLILYLLMLLLTSIIAKGLLLRLITSDGNQLVVVDPLCNRVVSLPLSAIRNIESESIWYPRIGRVPRLRIHYRDLARERTRNPLSINFLGKKNLANLASYFLDKVGTSWYVSLDSTDKSIFSFKPKESVSDSIIESSPYTKAVLIDVFLVAASLLIATGMMYI